MFYLPKDELYKEKPKFSNAFFGEKHFLSHCIIFYIGEDRLGNLLVGTGDHGLCVINKKRDKLINYTSDIADPLSINNNHVKCIFEDQTGVLWIGTLGGGCNKVDLYQKQFHNFRITIDDGNAKSNFIRALHEDDKGLLWIGTLNSGLYTYNMSQNIYLKIPSVDGNIEQEKIYSANAIYGNNVFSIKPVKEDKLWIGTDGGINIINKTNGNISHHLADYSNFDSLASNSIFTISTDDDNHVWIGNWNGLQEYSSSSKDRGIFYNHYAKQMSKYNKLSDFTIRYVYNDPVSTDMWVATMRRGLHRLIKQENNTYQIIQYNSSGEKGSLSDAYVTMIHRDKTGVLWVCTQNGLNKFIPGEDFSGTFKKYNEEDGLAGSSIQSILEDEKGILWLGTNKGITQFNTNSEGFTNYNSSDGIISDEFSEHTCFKNKNGKMYFGGVNGITSFYPDSIKTNKSIPKVVFTKLTLSNKEVPIGKMTDGRTLLEKPLWETEKIELSHKDRFFTIEFSALHFASPNDNQYAYLIEEISNEWIYTDYRNRRVNFADLKSGDYTLKVKASNNDSLWQTNPATLIIKIKPPIWSTWPAKLLYVIILGLILYFILKEFSFREKLKTQVALKNLEIKKSDELNDLKLQFFTNISHEFRTPLTLIITPLKKMLNSIKVNDDFKEDLNLMYKNSEYLLNLTNELLEFRKTEKSTIKLHASKNKIIEYISDIASSFKALAEKKSIRVELISNTHETDVWFDKNLLNKIFNNLIFNALKFTPENGKITFIIEESRLSDVECKFPDSFMIGEDEELKSEIFTCIRIIDTGIGISALSIEKIFDRFYQVGTSDTTDHLGSGIGLALTKNLVLLNKGVIIVSSERHRGTEFIVCLRKGESHFSDSEKILNDKTQMESKPFVIEPPNHLGKLINEGNNDSSFLVKTNKKESILIVEDNNELRTFIKESFLDKYKVYEAINGVEGLEIAGKVMPDIVVSDVMMPEMDGVTLCAKLKKERVTSHIPVILLTALSSVEDQIKGFETGADYYIAKPFDLKMLQLRIHNLLESRKALRERFSKEINIETKEITQNSKDKEFLDELINLVKERMHDQDFNVSELALKMLLSRSQLLRKVKALTNQTPLDLIRTIRLKESLSLLANNNYSISEVAYRVGFSTPSHFGQCFKEQFGVTPKEYLQKQLQS